MYKKDHFRIVGLALCMAALTTHAQVYVPGNGVTDADGNFYPTIVYSNGQEWMADNLKTTRYDDGSDILLIDNDAWWAAQAVPMPQNTAAYCWYGDDIANKELFGALYSWFVIDPIHNGGRSVCPSGWRVPASSDRIALVDHLVLQGLTHDGSPTITGPFNKLAKALADTAHWLMDTVTVGVPGNGPELNNTSGFTGRPGGSRGYTDGLCLGLGEQGHWWDSDDQGPGNPDQSTTYTLLLYGGQSLAQHLGSYFGNKMSGKSIRCMRSVTTGTGDTGEGMPLRAFPNPFKDRLVVELPLEMPATEFILRDVMGRTVMTGRLAGGTSILDLQHLSPGCYLLSSPSGGEWTMRLLKE
jgi:uncharacterized protein (TIGR02145 family)